jgi:hypothetical protein
MVRASLGTWARLVVLAAALAACEQTATSRTDDPLHPLTARDATSAEYEFGSGTLATTNDASWGGRQDILFPAVVDSDAGVVELEIMGLDLSGIEFTGTMGWPVREDDSGAQVWASLLGSREVMYRIWSSLADLPEERDADGRAIPPAQLRAYQLLGFLDDDGAWGMHRLAVEKWGPEGSRAPYNTIDVRVRLDGGLVTAQVRLHASLAWEEEGRASGAACPRNVAVNNAVDGTADSVWAGECRVEQPGASGRPVGAWIPVAGGPWTVPEPLGLVRPRLSVLNWQQAHGPYRVSWDNVILRGPPAPVPSSWARGGLRAFGTGGAEVEPRGAWAELSYQATPQQDGVNAAALLRYRSTDFDLVSQETRWVLIQGREISIAGTARVNGAGGYSYEVRGIAAESAPDSISLEVWGPVSGRRPHYAAFGALEEGSLEIVPARGG